MPSISKDYIHDLVFNKASAYCKTIYGEKTVKVDHKGSVIEIITPKHWSDKAAYIVKDKYMQKMDGNDVYKLVENVILGIIEGPHVQSDKKKWSDSFYKGSDKQEKHFLHTFDEILRKTFKNDIYPEDHNAFITGLFEILITQEAAFNSPVWFNFRPGKKDKVGSACFIFEIKDNLDDILEKIKLMGKVFSHGSGVGVNWSYLREENAKLSNGGAASGPISFMAMADSTANVVKSGGKTRRAALLFSLDVDHPDIEEFIQVKGIEEEKAHALIEYDNQNGGTKGWGQGMLDSEAYRTVKFQNANFSVAVTDRFMEAVDKDEDWELRSRLDQEVVKVVKARDIFNAIAEQAWKTGDPGLIFLDNMNLAVPEELKEEVRIRTTNPCLIGNTLLLNKGSLVRIDEGIEKENNQDWEWYSWYTGKKKVIKLITNAGHEIVLTPDHRIMLEDDSFEEAQNTLNKTIKWGLGSIDKFNNDYTFNLIGFLFGDGFLSGNKHGVSVKINEEKEPEVAQMLRDFGFHKQNNGTFYTNRTKLEKRIGLSLSFLEQRVWKRQLPNYILTTNNNIVGSFLKGLWEANGSINAQAQLSLKSTNRTTLQDIQKLLSIFGIHSYISSNKRQKIKWHNGTYESRMSYNLQIAPRNSCSFINRIGFLSNTKNNKTDCKNGSYKTKLKVIRIEDAGEADVYDFHMKEGSPWNYANGFICHNCGEFSFADSSACNLASINLIPNYKGRAHTASEFKFIVYTMIMAMDVIVDITHYVYDDMTAQSQKYRPLGLGYANLGALILSKGHRYGDSNAIQLTEHWTKLMTRYSHEISSILAEKYGQFYSPKEDARRNIFTTLLAPTGTISFMMDAESTGIEPYFSLISYKRMVGGDIMELIPPIAKAEAEKHDIDIHNITEEVLRTYPQFATAMFGLMPEDHLNIQIAAQKYLDMAISKTINLPKDATVDQIKDIYFKAWKSGLKGITIYRDGSKIFVPLSTSKDDNSAIISSSSDIKTVYYKEKLPEERQAIIHKFSIGGHEGYITFGFYPDGRIGEIFIEMAKEGSTLSGLADAFATAISMGLQHGIPIAEFIRKFRNWRFEPSGWVQGTHIDFHSADSVIDYVFRVIDEKIRNEEWKPNRVEESFLDEFEEVPNETEEEHISALSFNEYKDMECPNCGAIGTLTKRAGGSDCLYCELCGETTGCS